MSLNVRGLNNGMKRRKIFRYLKRQKADVCLLQETFCSKKTEFMWTSEWGNKCIFSNGESNSCGVSIMLDKSISSKVTEIRRDMAGRFIQIKLEWQNKSIGITNVYAPNHNDATFFENSFKEMESLDCTYNIISGDFNVVPDGNDRSNKQVYHKKCKQVIDNFVEANNFGDIWRIMHPDERFFTYMNNTNRRSWSRIDYFLVSQGVQLACVDASIKPSINTDHSLISMDICFGEYKRGPGSWKFNNTMLNNHKFVEDVNLLIKGCNRIYSYMDPVDYWDLLKFEIGQFCRNESSNKSQIDKAYRYESYEKLSRMQQEFIQDEVPDPELARNMVLLEKEIDAFETIDAKKAAFCCK